MNEKAKEFLSWAKIILAAIVVAFIINNVVIVNAEVPTSSMENTIMTGDRILALRMAYLFEEPARGDVVVFKFPDDENEKYVKRIIGLPGEKINIVSGQIYINDSEEPLEEEYLKEIPKGSFGPYIVPKDCYFMMGDNRNVSLDSRYWNNQFVKKEKLIGKVLFRYAPSFHIIN